MNMDTLSEEDMNKLWKDDKFCLEKERKSKIAKDLKIQIDYANKMGVSFFKG